MEVHHPHHIGHKKKWNEYIIEFIMLFVAVSLGFFAENLREQQVEKHREISYLQNVHEDLQLDIKSIDTVIKSNDARLITLDSLFAKLNDESVTNEDIYYYVRNLALRSTFESSHIGFDQIKSSGGLRMVKNKEITSGIQQYEKTLSAIEKLEELRDRTLEQGRFKMSKVFNAKVLYEMSVHQAAGGIIRFPRPSHADDIIKKDKDALNELLNLVATGLNTNRYLTSQLKILLKHGKQLDQAIMQEYGGNMH
ncbi:MAG: hypothetical protein RL634_2100 [Bacteroidota bacterium]|jgi:hypothetical protein